jgi:uncharacterized protein YerC
MNNIKDILNRYALLPHRYTIKKNATIIDTDDGHFVFKKRDIDNKMEELFKYLKSRNFLAIPNLINRDDAYDVYEYIDDVDTPREQKALDMMSVIATLHYKTTYFKDADEDDFKAIYEDIVKQIDYINNYYTDVITMIETNVYMSPSEYLIARNISKVFNAITFCKREIDEWYELVKDKHKKRVVTLHNNLDLDHLVRNQDLFLLSWDKSRQDMPIFDLINFYKHYALELDFAELFNLYESKYKLLDEERKLFFILISIPDKITYGKSEMESCSTARKLLDYIFKTEQLLTPYYTPNNSDESHQLTE